MNLQVWPANLFHENSKGFTENSSVECTGWIGGISSRNYLSAVFTAAVALKTMLTFRHTWKVLRIPMTPISSRFQALFKKQWKFTALLRRAKLANPEPKVFLKMGSFHMGRHRSPLNLYDIGSQVSQVAESRNEPSVHIYYLNRFFEGRDVKGRSGWEGSERFISVGDKEEWALVDLRPLRKLVSNETLTGTPFEIQTIQNYDFIIIAPEDDWVNKLW